MAVTEVKIPPNQSEQGQRMLDSVVIELKLSRHNISMTNYIHITIALGDNPNIGPPKFVFFILGHYPGRNCFYQMPIPILR